MLWKTDTKMNNDYLVREFGKVTFFNNSVNYEETEVWYED